MSERCRPEGIDRRDYVLTVVARDGRFNDSETLIRESGYRIGQNPLHFSAWGNVCLAYREGEALEFDVYHPITNHNTRTRTFDREFGAFLSMLLKTGFSIKAERRLEVEPRSKARTDF